MKPHIYLRAYMAGILLPSWFLLGVLGLYLLGHMSRHVPEGVERAIIFPMAVVPNVWGLWNLLYLRLGLRTRISLGVFGACLPLLLIPAGIALATALDLRFYTAGRAIMVLPVLMGIYYLAWKYGVGYFNRVVELR